MLCKDVKWEVDGRYYLSRDDKERIATALMYYKTAVRNSFANKPEDVEYACAECGDIDGLAKRLKLSEDYYQMEE